MGGSEHETVLLGTHKAINLYEMDVDELERQKKEIEREGKKFIKERNQIKKGKRKEIKTTEEVTEHKIEQRSRDIEKILELKDANSKADFERKEKVLRKNF